MDLDDDKLGNLDDQIWDAIFDLWEAVEGNTMAIEALEDAAWEVQAAIETSNQPWIAPSVRSTPANLWMPVLLVLPQPPLYPQGERAHLKCFAQVRLQSIIIRLPNAFINQTSILHSTFYIYALILQTLLLAIASISNKSIYHK